MIRKLAVLLVLALTLVSTPSSALLVQPIFLDMRYSGIRSNSALRVVNDRNRPVTVEVTVSELTIPERGEVVFTPIEGEDFLIFPAVATVDANATQIFRVRWIGEAAAEGRTFALTTSELPVSVEPTAGATLELLYAIRSIVAIGPDRAQSDIQAIAVERGTNAGGETGVRVLFANEGALHGQVENSTVRVATSGWSHTLSPADTANAVGLGLIGANSRRWMFFPIPDVPDTGDLTASIDIAQPR